MSDWNPPGQPPRFPPPTASQPAVPPPGGPPGGPPPGAPPPGSPRVLRPHTDRGGRSPSRSLRRWQRSRSSAVRSSWGAPAAMTTRRPAPRRRAPRRAPPARPSHRRAPPRSTPRRHHHRRSATCVRCPTVCSAGTWRHRATRTRRRSTTGGCTANRTGWTRTATASRARPCTRVPTWSRTGPRRPTRRSPPTAFRPDCCAGTWRPAASTSTARSTYFIWEGSPARMDADGNGIPCETVYPDATEVWLFEF